VPAQTFPKRQLFIKKGNGCFYSPKKAKAIAAETKPVPAVETWQKHESSSMIGFEV